MIFRETKTEDIAQMQFIRNSVQENKLSNPDLVKDADYAEFINGRGKGWVCEEGDKIMGFAFVDMEYNNIWALFVHPQYEGNGIAQQLQKHMLNWYFNQTKVKVWLGTAPNTRAERFYRKSGWTEVGVVNKGETKFEMTFENWNTIKEL